MLELINVRLPLDAGLPQHEDLLFSAAAKTLKIPARQLASVALRKRSVDARKKNDVHFTATLVVDAGAHEKRILSASDKNVRPLHDETYRPQRYGGPAPKERPVVVGAGCAGLFAALVLAQAGLCPLVLERGQRSARRTHDIETFDRTGALDTESNIQFGLGGAGTFSDGKLTTNTSSPYHRYILESLVDAGAPAEILWQAKPHVGSDYLPQVVDALCTHIEKLGGRVLFGAHFDRFDTSAHGSVCAAHYTRDGSSHVQKTGHLILATGHSARDTFAYLADEGVALERKVFSMGVRIEHAQKDVDLAQYGKAASHPALGAADYKLVAHLPNGRSAYTFCMCPGGTVVAAASEIDQVCTNGMSLFARAGKNANAGFLVNVNPHDLEGDSILAGIELQRACEKAAYERGGGAYRAPATLLKDFLAGRPSSDQGRIAPTYTRGVTWTSLEGCLPAYILQTLRDSIPVLQRRMRCFADQDAVLTGVETRSSSPIRIVRDKDRCVSLSTPGLVPCGEGAGYAGGIMSAAADGVRCAEAVMNMMREEKGRTP